MAKSKRPATLEDLAKLPEHLVGEIIDGELIATPRPAIPHATAGAAIHGQLWGAFNGSGGDGPGGWWILFEPELHLDGNVLVPDVAGWRRERLPKLPNEAAFTLPPDWVCEIVSASTERIDRSRKMDCYERAAVPFAWLVNPLSRTLEVYRLAQQRWQREHVYAGSERVRAVPFDAIELDLGRWWLEE